MKRRGVLRLSRGFLEDGQKAKAFLPPDHKIIAIRDDLGWPWIECLVEGPLMFEVEDDVFPENVTIIVRQTAENGKVTARFGAWEHKPTVEWPIS